MRYCLNYTGTRFLSTENKITQFPLFRLNILEKKSRQEFKKFQQC